MSLSISNELDPVGNKGRQTTQAVVERMGIKVGSVFTFQDYLNAAGGPDGKWAGFQYINRDVPLLVTSISNTYHGEPDDELAEFEYRKAEVSECPNQSS